MEITPMRWTTYFARIFESTSIQIMACHLVHQTSKWLEVQPWTRLYTRAIRTSSNVDDAWISKYPPQNRFGFTRSKLRGAWVAVSSLLVYLWSWSLSWQGWFKEDFGRCIIDQLRWELNRLVKLCKDHWFWYLTDHLELLSQNTVLRNSTILCIITDSWSPLWSAW